MCIIHANACFPIKARLNEVGVEPLVELVDHITETFGPFDITPAPEATDDDLAEENWRGTWSDDYELPDHLPRLDDIKKSARQLKIARTASRVDRNSTPEHAITNGSGEFDADRRGRITKTLAWLHSRGESAVTRLSD